MRQPVLSLIAVACIGAAGCDSQVNRDYESADTAVFGEHGVDLRDWHHGRCTVLENAEEDLTTVRDLDCREMPLTQELKSRIEAAPCLRYLKIPCASPEQVEWVTSLTHLEAACLPHGEINAAQLTKLASFKHLRFLDLWDAKFVDSTGNVPPFEHLEMAYFAGCKEDHLRLLAGSGDVKAVRIDHAAISDQGLAKLVRSNPNIQHLMICWCRSLTTDSVDELAKLKHLKFLHIGNTKLESEYYHGETDTVPVLHRNLAPGCGIHTGS